MTRQRQEPQITFAMYSKDKASECVADSRFTFNVFVHSRQLTRLGCTSSQRSVPAGMYQPYRIQCSPMRGRPSVVIPLALRFPRVKVRGRATVNGRQRSSPNPPDDVRGASESVSEAVSSTRLADLSHYSRDLFSCRLAKPDEPACQSTHDTSLNSCLDILAVHMPLPSSCQSISIPLEPPSILTAAIIIQTPGTERHWVLLL